MSSLISDTLYVGSMSPTVSSVCVEAESSNEALEAGDNTSPVEETKKEQNRRLLIQHRESKARAQKLKREKCLHETDEHTTELPTIKEEERSDESSDSSRGDKVIDDERRNEVQFFLNRKFIAFGGVRRGLRRVQRKPVKNSPPANVLRFDCWNEVVLSVAYVILLFSSSAARYAMFRSLKSFEPGD